MCTGGTALLGHAAGGHPIPLDETVPRGSQEKKVREVGSGSQKLHWKVGQ